MTTTTNTTNNTRDNTAQLANTAALAFVLTEYEWQAALALRDIVKANKRVEANPEWYVASGTYAIVRDCHEQVYTRLFVHHFGNSPDCIKLAVVRFASM